MFPSNKFRNRCNNWKFWKSKASNAVLLSYHRRERFYLWKSRKIRVSNVQNPLKSHELIVFRMKSFIAIICLLICASTSYATKSHPITTLLNAKWHTTPIYLEISEFLFDESPNLYWDYVKELVNLPISKYDAGENIAVWCRCWGIGEICGNIKNAQRTWKKNWNKSLKLPKNVFFYEKFSEIAEND